LLKFGGVGSNRDLLLNYYNNISGLLNFIKVSKILLYLSHKDREFIEHFINLWLTFLGCFLHLILKIEFEPLSCCILKIDCHKHNLSVFIQKIWHVEKEVEFQLRNKYLELLSFSIEEVWFSHFSLLSGILAGANYLPCAALLSLMLKITYLFLELYVLIDLSL